MGMASSQARYLALAARKSNCEYEGQQINQARTALANQSANLFNQMLGLSVPVPPSTQDFTKTQYSFTDGINGSVIDSWKQLATPDDKGYNYVVDYHYLGNVYKGYEKRMNDPQIQFTYSVPADETVLASQRETVDAIYNAQKAVREAQEEYDKATAEYSAMQTRAANYTTYRDRTTFRGTTAGYDPASKQYYIKDGENNLTNFSSFYDMTGYKTLSEAQAAGLTGDAARVVKAVEAWQGDGMDIDVSRLYFTSVQNGGATFKVKGSNPAQPVTRTGNNPEEYRYRDDAVYASQTGITAVCTKPDGTVLKKIAKLTAPPNTELTIEYSTDADGNIVTTYKNGDVPVAAGDVTVTYKDGDEDYTGAVDTAYRTSNGHELELFDGKYHEILPPNQVEVVSASYSLADTVNGTPAIALYTDIIDMSGAGNDGGATTLSIYNFGEAGDNKDNPYTIYGMEAKLNELKNIRENKYAILQDAEADLEAINMPEFAGNSKLTSLGELTESDITEIRQIITDMTANGAECYFTSCFTSSLSINPEDYTGGIYTFERDGMKYYTTYFDLANTAIESTFTNDIDNQPKLSYYYATNVSENIYTTSKAILDTDSKGRFKTVRFEDSATTYTLNYEQVTDDEAYKDAMNQYYYENAKYDKMVQDINAKTSIIQQEDRTLELRLKQLDTEQNALKTEMEAVQKIVKDNVDSTFKTFSN